MVALHFCEYYVIFLLQWPSDPSELLFDAGNWTGHRQQDLYSERVFCRINLLAMQIACLLY